MTIFMGQQMKRVFEAQRRDGMAMDLGGEEPGHFTDGMIDAAAKIIYAARSASEPHWPAWTNLESKEKRGFRQTALRALKAAEAEIQ
jgi:hypothetical protein